MSIRVIGGTTCMLVRSLPADARSPSRYSRLNVGAHMYTMRDYTLPTNPIHYNAALRITYVDRAIIRAYFHTSDGVLSIAETDTIASLVGADGKLHLLPEKLECKLSALPSSYVRALSGDSVILIETVTHTIMDCMHDIRTAPTLSTSRH